MSVRLAATIVAALAAALVAASGAQAHVGGKAEPRIAASLRGDGLVQTLTVRLTDRDGGGPIEGASVSAFAQMTRPHVMRTAPWELSEREPGVYAARIQFLMPARWLVRIDVEGSEVVPASAELRVDIERGAAAAGPEQGSAVPGASGDRAESAPGGEALTVLPTRLDERVTTREAAEIAILWVHGLAAGAWMVGVLVMVVALGSPAGVLAEGWRSRLAAWYRSSGAWLHWGLVPVVVGTGVYNMLRVTPFSLVWSPGGLDGLAAVPYGSLYEAILIVKLGLFAALLISGTQLLRRTVAIHPAPSRAPAGAGFLRTLAAGLGPSGVVYLVAVPLVLGAAAALRYVHVLSHVADVVQAAP